MSDDSKRIVVVIPAYDAIKTLPSVFQRIPKDTYDRIFRFIVVEDGGESVPRSVTEKLLEEFDKIEVVAHDRNRGYGAAQKTGFRRALTIGADTVVLLHADGQYAPEMMADLYAPLLADQTDVVLGSRMHSYRSALSGGMPFYKLFSNAFLTGIANLCYGMRLTEYHSGYMLYGKKALEKIPFEKLTDGFHFDGQMLLVAGKKKLRILDLPIPTFYGDEKCHVKPIRYGFEVLHTILQNFNGKYDYGD